MLKAFSVILLLILVICVFLFYKLHMFYRHIVYLKWKLNVKDIQMNYYYHLALKHECGLDDYCKEHGIKNIAVYGVGMGYESTRDEFQGSIPIRYYIDKYTKKKVIDGKPVIKPGKLSIRDSVDAIIVTAVGLEDQIKRELVECGCHIRIISVEEILFWEKEK